MVKIRRHQHTRVHAHTGPRRHATQSSGVSRTPHPTACQESRRRMWSILPRTPRHRRCSVSPGAKHYAGQWPLPPSPRAHLDHDRCRCPFRRQAFHTDHHIVGSPSLCDRPEGWGGRDSIAHSKQNARRGEVEVTERAALPYSRTGEL